MANKEKVLPRWTSSELNPFALFGIETGPGWRPIAQKVIDAIIEYDNNAPEGSVIYIDQVKEKFAMLEIYVTYENVPEDVVERINSMISEARQEASETCEFCGTKENVGMQVNGWYTVICEDCARRRTMKAPYYQQVGIKWKRNNDGKLFFIKQKETVEIDPNNNGNE